jgi:hypothetical protein
MVIYAFAVIVLMRAQIGGVAALLRRLWRPDPGHRNFGRRRGPSSEQ